MRKPLPALFLASLLSSGLALSVASAPVGPRHDPFKGVQQGDRVRVFLRTKAQFTGVARKVSPEELTIDLKLEEKGIEGTMGFRADLVARVEPLKSWDQKEKEKREAERVRRLQEAAEELKRAAMEREKAVKADEEAAKQSAEAAAAGEEGGEARDSAAPSAEDLQKGIELLKEFPPKEGWGTAPDKTVDWLKTKVAVVGAALTASEQRFVDQYELWLKAKEAAERPPEPEAPAGAAPNPEAPSPPAPESPPPAPAAANP